jgi:hypothetical protein
MAVTFRLAGSLQLTGTPMVIHAAAMFRCVHEYVATPEDGLVLLVCFNCHRRATELPLARPTPARRVAAFPSSRALACKTTRRAGSARKIM